MLQLKLDLVEHYIMEKDKNIFETAAKKLGHKEGKSPSESPRPAKERPPAQKNTYRDPEVADMMRQISEMNQDLQSKMESISKKSGLSYDDLKKLIDNPKLLSPAQIEYLKKSKEQLGEQVWDAVGVPTKPQPKQRENKTGERKAKTLGARKKWIPMR